MVPGVFARRARCHTAPATGDRSRRTAGRAGAARRPTRHIARTSLVAVLTALAAVLGWSVAFGAAAASATTPPAACQLSWRITAGSDASTTGRPSAGEEQGDALRGAGLGANQRVRLVLYPRSRALGAWTTDPTGRFSIPLGVLRVAGDAPRGSWLTATSRHAVCSTAAPRLLSLERSLPRKGTAAGSSGSGSASDGTDGTPQAGYPPTLPGSGFPGTGTGASGTPTTTPTGSSGSTTPSHSASASPTPSHSSAGATPPSTSPTSPGPSRSTSVGLGVPSNVGVPATFVVAIAVLLLLAGGGAVVFLTRRGG